MKKIVSILLICMLSMSLSGCQLTKRFVKDNSDKMPQIEISDDKYQMTLIKYIAPIAQDGYTLKSQSISIKNGRIDRSGEVSKIDTMITNVDAVRSKIIEMNVSDNKKTDKELLISALDAYTTQLTDYKNVLSLDELDKEQLQYKIDNVMNALENVKQWSK